MKKYEYAVFTVRVPFDHALAREPYIRLDLWPDQIMQAALLTKMNELGADGWEIFERVHSAMPPSVNDETYPYNFWARRVIQ
jgi:hypothetical protein